MKNRLIFFIVTIMFCLSSCGGGSGGSDTSAGPDISDVRDSIYRMGCDNSNITIAWEHITDAEDNPVAGLEYRGFYSASDNINTAGDAQANGTPMDDWSVAEELNGESSATGL